MTSYLGDISAWEGHVVPGLINPLFRKGLTVNPSHHRIRDVEAPTQEIKPREGLGEGNQLIKQLVTALKKVEMSKITEALPQYRSN